MKRTLLISIALGITLSGCDLLQSDPPEPPFGEVSASLNGAEWFASPRATVVFTEQVYVPRDDSMLSMQFDALTVSGFRTGALVMTFPYRGPGDYEIHYADVTLDPDTSGVTPDTLSSIVSFYDTQHNAISAHLALEEGNSFRVNIHEVDRNLGQFRGSFDGRLVYYDGQTAGSPNRNYPDTLRFVDGSFESEIDFVRAAP